MAEAARLDRRFLVVWAGQVVSVVGTMISGFGAAVWIFVETDSLLWLSVLIMMATLPAVLAAPLSGWVDRLDRRMVMIAADTAAAAITAGLVAIWIVGDLAPWHLVVGTFVAGFASSFQQPAYEAAIPSLVDREQLDRANGLVQLGPSLAVVAAPGLAGLLLAAGGIGAVFAVDLATFLIGVLAVLAVRFVARPTPTDGDSMRIRDAAGWLWEHARSTAYLIGLMAVLNFFLAIFNLGILARGTLLGGEAGAGVAPTVGGISMVVVSLMIGVKGAPRRRVRALAWSLAAFGGCVLLAVSRPSLLMLVIGVGLGMMTAPLVQTIASTTFHERVEPSMQGRVFGLRNALGRGTHPIGALVAGPLAAWSLTGAFVIVGVAAFAMAAVVGFSGVLRPLDLAPAAESGAD